MPWLKPIIPATQDVEIGGLWFEASPDKKLKFISANKPDVVVCTCNPAYSKELQKHEPYLKNN
jgi:hypothetical protein